ncbi:alginate lyase family protein [Echinimonas agarilytica]|uniref:Alginate lyase family protein n=1 Tax=Echinimonas agarilytica TaxID=1215918 RepID=A0AA42B6G8_9GAMM|nr:alginate lyase family protein [Echinimonas agarilytica]MCM2678416.1 alginate lyase family protein [Echinimonas agarilytica]
MQNSLSLAPARVRKIKTSLFTALLAVSGTFASALVSAEMLPGYVNDTYNARHIWQKDNQSLSNKSFTCPDLIEPLHQFESGSIYLDTPCRCEIDPVKQAIYEAEKKALDDFNKVLISNSDRYVATPIEREEIAQCVVEHLEHWANADAMLGDHAENLGYHKSADLLGAVASSFAKIRNAEGTPLLDENSSIGYWMTQLGDTVIEYYDSIEGSKTSRNNHRYWDGFSVGRSAVLLQNQAQFGWAMEGLKIGLNEVEADGTLPLEMARGSKAHQYHIYALQPLIGLAELSIANLEYMPDPFYPYGYNDEALVRLAQLMIEEQLRTEPSEIFLKKDEMVCYKAAWAEIYLRRTPLDLKHDVTDFVLNKRAECNNTLYSTGMGGNMLMLYGSRNLSL